MSLLDTVREFPVTPKHPVTDTYHGEKIVDEYRWLEDFTDPAVRQWNAAQNQYSRAALDSLPAHKPLAKRFWEVMTQTSASYYALKQRGGRLFAMKNQPPKQQHFLVVMKSADDPDSERVVIDPVALNSQATTSIDWYQPSFDGRLVAMSLSEKGSEKGMLHIFDVETGQALTDVIPRVQNPTAGGSVAWTKDASGVYYTRYPAPDERPAEDLEFYQQVYYHQLGRPVSEDLYLFGKDLPRIAEIGLQTFPDNDYLLVIVKNGDGGEHAHYLRNAVGEWTQITRFEDYIPEIEVGNDQIFLLSYKGAPRGQILQIPLANPDLTQAKIIVAERSTAINQMIATDNQLYVIELDGGPSHVTILDINGVEQGTIPMPPVSSVDQLVALDGDTILFRGESYVQPAAWYRFTPTEEEPKRTALFVKSGVDASQITVKRMFATSKDGTQVPMNIIHREGITLNGANPTLLYGYGGYGISLTPKFPLNYFPWLEQGGILLMANIRGGGEYGEGWHRAGNLTNKQTVFDDFIACARTLIDSGYTSPTKLAIMGGSNGGLLMGAALTQRPDLFRAVVCYVGVLDAVRVEVDPNGAFNVTEFGTVTNPDHFHAIRAYSPYQNVVDGTAYPAVLFITGDHDGRVNPAHSRKMTARLQAATSSHLPILLRTSATSGHGIGTALNDKIAENADAFAFLFDLLGMTFVE